MQPYYTHACTNHKPEGMYMYTYSFPIPFPPLRKLFEVFPNPFQANTPSTRHDE